MRVGFLVYASRSGSTLLGARLQAGVEDLCVSRELFFHRLFQCSPGTLKTGPAAVLAKRLMKGGGLRNLGLTADEVAAAIDATDRTHGGVLHALMGRYLAAEGRSSASMVLIKQGVHAFHWPAIRERIPGAFFILVRRDPRAVIASKLRTKRPYFPEETMGWAGPAANAMQWCRVERAVDGARAAGVTVHEVRYEDLIDDPDGEIGRLAALLGLPRARSEASEAYEVPEAEKAIHTLVHGDVQRARTDAWRTELSAGQIADIEAVASRRMERHGYQPVATRSPFARSLRVVSAVPGTAWNVLRHLLYHARVHHR